MAYSNLLLSPDLTDPLSALPYVGPSTALASLSAAGSMAGFGGLGFPIGFPPSFTSPSGVSPVGLPGPPFLGLSPTLSEGGSGILSLRPLSGPGSRGGVIRQPSRRVSARVAAQGLGTVTIRGRGVSRGGRTGSRRLSSAGRGLSSVDVRLPEAAAAEEAADVAVPTGTTATGRGGTRGRGNRRTAARSAVGWTDPLACEPAEPHVEFDVGGQQHSLEQLGAADLPRTVWSVTLSRQTQNVPYSWLYSMDRFLQRYSLLGMFAYELGGRIKRGHLQGVMALRWPGDAHHKKLLIQYIGEWLEVSSYDQKHFTIKVLKEGQTLSCMLGYCQKDRLRSTYKFVRFNISNDDLTTGRIDYASVATDYRQNRLEIDRNNIGDLLYAFYLDHIKPMVLSPHLVLYYMIQRGEAVPSAKYLTYGSSALMEHHVLDAWWRCATDHPRVTLADIMMIFFRVPPPDELLRKEQFLQGDEPVEWDNITTEVARQRALTPSEVTEQMQQQQEVVFDDHNEELPLEGEELCEAEDVCMELPDSRLLDDYVEEEVLETEGLVSTGVRPFEGTGLDSDSDS